MHFYQLFSTAHLALSFKKAERRVILFKICSDVVVVNGLFGDEDDMSIYNNLLDEIQSSGIDQGKQF